ncbi:hypothetical protein GS429_06980 [Natronorubrum sp. JWXQ-INN-674]|uniref:Restriction endonuclease type IV Mrr domain-containing protein n=1 Tax=Natronorubrum halalkaliphilum TaxID=2691917 RepID=A0A6B0VM18_9EURY|nr:restriction endonuclease [Natronorubrum halalkaliphilum]MXV61812.1 hypothetical protein [Natronorubrum halalkaliphilum]
MTESKIIFDDLRSAFTELYESRCSGSWFVEVKGQASPILRASVGRFDCLHTLPAEKFREQERFFRAKGLETTRNVSADRNSDWIGLSRDDVGSLIAEGDILTPDHATEITRDFLTEVHECHVDEFQVYLVHEGGEQMNYNLEDVFSTRRFRRTYQIIPFVTCILWIPLLALLADGFTTISTNPLSIFSVANTFIGYLLFIVVFAIGVGAGAGMMYHELPESATNQLDGTLFSIAIHSGITQLAVGGIVGVVGGLILVLSKYTLGNTIGSVVDIVAVLLVLIGLVGIISLIWFGRVSNEVKPFIGAVLVIIAISDWIITFFSTGSTSGTWPSLVLGSMFATVALMGLVSPTANLETYLETYIDSYQEAQEKYQAAKHRHEIIKEAAPPDIVVDVDVETCNPDVTDGPAAALKHIDRVHSELTQIGKEIEQYRIVTKAYETLKERQEKLQRRAQPFGAIDAEMRIKDYQVKDEDAAEYRAYLKSVKADLSTLEESVNAWEQAKKEYENLREFQKELNRRAQPLNIADEDVEIVPISSVATDREVTDYRSHLKSVRTELEERECGIERQERYRDVQDRAKELRERIQLSAQTHSGTPFDALETDITASFEAASDDSAEELENYLDDVEEIHQNATSVLNFLDRVDHSHPSVDEPAWRDAVEMALTECYPNVLRPIASDIAAMEEGCWERDDLATYTWDEFESLVGSYYRNKGYDVEVTQVSHDGGVDVWATNKNETVAIQVKQYNGGNRVGRPTLQRLVSVIAKGDADRVVVVTSAEFTDSAVEYANEFGEGLDLIDGTDLVDRLSRSELLPSV